MNGLFISDVVVLVASLFIQAPLVCRAAEAQPSSEATILYTGRLFGYMRCTDNCGPGNAFYLDSAELDPDTLLFPASVDAWRHARPEAVLVGMGDNFAPFYRSRVQPYGQHPAWKSRNTHALITSDNVAQFLRAAHYDAIVPGKEDFYFGLYRLYQLGEALKNNVPFLAANLALQPTKAVQHDKRKLKDKQKPYLSELDGLKPLFESTATPWLSSLAFEIQQNTVLDLSNVNASLCKAVPNPELPGGNCASWTRVQPKHSEAPGGFAVQEGIDEQRIIEFVPTYPSQGTKYPMWSGNYLFCLSPVPSPPQKQNRYCTPIQIAEPMFSIPYIIKNNTVAVFGVVNPHMRSYLSHENATWTLDKNVRPPIGIARQMELKVLPPETALAEVLDRFKLENPGFAGIFVLLAQMKESEAQELAVHIPSHRSVVNSKAAPFRSAFDLVIAEAEQPHATPNEVVQRRRESFPTALVVVPHPVYDDSVTPPRTINPLNVVEIDRQPELISYCNIVVGSSQETDCMRTGKQLRLLAQSIGPSKPIEPAQSSPGEPIQPAPIWTALVNNVCRDCTIPSPYTCDPTSSTENRFRSRFRRDFQNLTLRTLMSTAKADIAMLQERDFFYSKCNDAEDVPVLSLQELLDRILWKGDLLTTIVMTGADIKTVIRQSNKYEEEERSATNVAADEKGRPVVMAGILKGKNKGSDDYAYYVDADNFDDERLYVVATSGHMATGDTGYPVMATPAAGRQVQFVHRTAKRISGVVCKALSSGISNPVCMVDIEDASYRLYTAQLGTLPLLPQDNRRNSGLLQTWSEWGKDFVDEKPFSTDPLEKQLQSTRTFWIFNLEDLTGGYTLSDPVASLSQLKEFSGIALSAVRQPTRSELKLHDKLRVVNRRSWMDWGAEETLDYDRARQVSLSGGSQTSWIPNSLSAGPLIQLHTHAYQPHWMYLVLRPLQFGSDISDTTFDVDNGITVSHVALQRVQTITQKVGTRWEKDLNTYLEVGAQYGQSSNVLEQLTFTDGVQCSFAKPLDPALPADLSGCVTKHAKSKPGLSPPLPSFITLHQDGFYWDGKLTFPVLSRLKYVMDTHGDLFANWLTRNPQQPRETPAQTRYDVFLNIGPEVPIWGTLSLKPTFGMIWYQNKVAENSLFRRSFDIALKYSFQKESGVTLTSAMGYQSKKAGK